MSEPRKHDHLCSYRRSLVDKGSGLALCDCSASATPSVEGERDKECELVAQLRALVNMSMIEIEGHRHWSATSWVMANAADTIERLLTSHSPAAPAESSERERVLEDLLSECSFEMERVRVFVSSREKVHPIGLAIYDDLIARVGRALTPSAPVAREPNETLDELERVCERERVAVEAEQMERVTSKCDQCAERPATTCDHCVSDMLLVVHMQATADAKARTPTEQPEGV